MRSFLLNFRIPNRIFSLKVQKSADDKKHALTQHLKSQFNRRVAIDAIYVTLESLVVIS